MQYKHGMTGTPTHKCWRDMKDRCFNFKAKRNDRYGGRGISVCDRWLSFENFYADMGDKPEGLTIDRIDNDGNYEPSNCCWATHSEQMMNRNWKGKGYHWNNYYQRYKIEITRYQKGFYFGYYKTEEEAQYWAEVAKEALDAYLAIQNIYHFKEA